MKRSLPMLVMLCASWCIPVFAAPVPIVSGSAVAVASPASKAAPQWDHHGHILFCAQRGAKNCPGLTIPPGIKNKDILSIVRTRVVPGAKFEVTIVGRKNVYLCVSGDTSKLLCQKLPIPDANVAASAPEVVAARLQNTITLLTNRRATGSTGMNRSNLIDVGGGCSYDEETGETTCEGGGGGGPDPDQAPDPGPSTDIPDPGGPSPAPGNSDPEAIAAPWIAEAVAESERGFEGSGAVFDTHEARCNLAVARCREDCGDRTNALYGMCTAASGVIAAGSKIAGLIFFGACNYKVYTLGAQCKTECVFSVIPCG